MMAITVKNPFLTKGYISASYFCDRKEETEKIVSAIENGRDLTLISPRKIGKTGLIHHVINQKKIKKDYNVFFCDLYQANNLAEMTTIIGNEVMNKLDRSMDGILRRVKEAFSGLRPSVSFNPITLQAEIDFNIKNSKQAQSSIQQIFETIRSTNKPSILILDEFQQIEKFAEKNVEAILRTNIQQSNNLRLIFSGSSKHTLLYMFSNVKRPFYQSTQLMELGKIDKKSYKRFIKNKFSKNRIQVDDTQLEYLLDITRTHTYHVQYLCNRLYDSNTNEISEKEINEMVNTILKENENYFFGFRNLLTDQQFQLLRAIAKEDGVAQPSSKNFMQAHNLGTTSTINSAIKSLMNKELIYSEDGKYVVYDVFFSLWLKNMM